MYSVIHNESYGWAVATYGDYVAAGNPSFLRWPGSTPSTYRSGSVDYFRYNKISDQHDLIKILYLHGTSEEILLARETGSDILVRDPLHTELGTIFSADKDLRLDMSNYFTSIDDGFGVSLDMYGKTLVVGVPYYTQSFSSSAINLLFSGSAVEIFNLGATETDINTDPYVISLNNPDINVVDSFGLAVGINSGWLAVGSPYVSSSKGMVYIYENVSTASNHFSWSLFQKIESPTPVDGEKFGNSVKLNKQSGEYSGSMVVGVGSTGSNAAYYYEYLSGSWTHSFTFSPTTNIYPLTFGSYTPFQPTMSINSAFGYDVSLYSSSVIIGAYLDRSVYEFTGSAKYYQGAVYIFEKCPGITPAMFELSLKTYGTPIILKNNNLGYSVDIFGNYAAAGIPKISMSLSDCYIQNTLGQLFYCNQSSEDTINGQVLLLQKNTSSLEWESVNIYQKKKQYLSPHRNFGHDVALGSRSMVVGAPLYISSSNGYMEIDIETTQSNNVDLDDLTGKAYIYNFPNLREEFHVGNVFYRNGKIVLMTSGSNFTGLFLNAVNTRPYEYGISFKGQRTLYEKQILCNVEPGEFNVSTNPTAVVKAVSTWDINKNGIFDFQDVDILLKYMQYKSNYTTDWSSSILQSDDEISFYNYNSSQWTNVDSIWSSSLNTFENINTTFLDSLDCNYDNRVDDLDMNLLWKYFCNRLDEKNYNDYINQNCQRMFLNDILTYLDSMSKRKELTNIKPEFFEYDISSSIDKTGSFLAPMVTTIGLYSGLDLVAVAKLGSPVKLPKTLPINFIVKIDF